MFISKTAGFLSKNTAKIVKEKGSNKVHFYSTKDTYLGTINKSRDAHYRFCSIQTFNENLKRKFYKTVEHYFSEYKFLPDKNEPDLLKRVAGKITTIITEKDYENKVVTKQIKERNLIENSTKQSSTNKDYKIKYSPAEIIDESQTKMQDDKHSSLLRWPFHNPNQKK